MRTALLLVASTFLTGCESESTSLKVAECLSLAAYQMLERVSPVSPVARCCGECNGTGLVRSGDGLEWVPCRCPDGCECKGKSSAGCPDGKCKIKN